MAFKGLPESGAMLIFVTTPHKAPNHVLHFLSEEELAVAEPVSPPEDMVPLNELYFWIDETAFPEWPIDQIPIIY